MPAPISGNQLKKLTQRLRDGTESPEDLRTLADVRIYYRQVLERAYDEVARLCAEIHHAEPMAPRVKTLKTTMEKLHRQPELRSLAQIRDLAGLRVVVHGTRADQDEIAARIGIALCDDGRPPKRIDRRADPRSGYRAVHMEIRREGVLIEVQVRTDLQHRWAELFERTADRLGRGLRYGEQVPLSPQSEALLTALAEMSEGIDLVERSSTTTDLDLAHSAGRLQAGILNLFATVTEYLEQLP
jgi:ppGpp synthetase/RelA/SpoT-type nucleotidyltranferase